MNSNIPYGAELMITNNSKIKKGDVICKWDPYNALIISEFAGKVVFDNVIEGVTYRQELDEQTGFSEKVITESRDKKILPSIRIIDPKSKDIIREYSLPVNAVFLKKINQLIQVKS